MKKNFVSWSLSLVLILTILFSGGCSRNILGKKPENVILITLDTVRADHLSCYGHPFETAPNISSFVDKSTLFTRAISQSSWTLPAHASILTGVYPHSHGAEQLKTPLDPSFPLLSEILNKEGFHTAAFVSSEFVSEKYRFHKGFTTFDSSLGPGEKDGIFAEGITDRALDWLEVTEGPFFLWLHYFDPHHYFMLHEEVDYGSISRVEEPETVRYHWWNVHPLKRDIPQEEIDDYLALYNGEIFYTDKHVGRLLDYLEEKGLMKKTCLIITSDHGESFNEHRLMGHDNVLYQDLIHVPLIVFVPGKPPSIDDHVTEIRNIMPTVLDLLGVNKPEYLAEGIFSSQRSAAYAEVHNRNPNRRIAVLQDRWKLIYTLEEEYVELYDLDKDSSETLNVAAEYPELVQDLRDALFATMDVLEIDEKTMERLRSLGYLK